MEELVLRVARGSIEREVPADVLGEVARTFADTLLRRRVVGPR